MKKLLTLLVLSISSFSILSLGFAQDFPVTIEHKFGSTTIEARPERVVTIGYTEQDALFTLGIQPIAIRYFYGDAPHAIFPWAVSEAGGHTPEVLNMAYGELNLEKILSLQPDVITAIGSGITDAEYENLSRIAPTIAQSDAYVDFGVPWQVEVRTLGEALGERVRAEARVTALEAQLAAVRDAHPEFEGKRIAVAYRRAGDEGYGFYTAQDGRGRFFEDLGFVVPEEHNEIAGDSFFAYISEERLDLLDQDLIVFLAIQFIGDDGQTVIREDPLLNQLEAVQDGRVVYVKDEQDDALQFGTVLSIEFLLENLVPELAAALSN
ncbi:MAG: iron-siderophore ABC transporter substrate-binding protein [Deinococcota bacterium]